MTPWTNRMLRDGRIPAAQEPAFYTASAVRVRHGDRSTISIDGADRVAGFDDHGRGHMHRITDLAEDRSSPGDPLLLSAGTILAVIDDRGAEIIPMGLRGSARTPVAEGQYNTACGRCSELPAETCIKELAEEFLLVVADDAGAQTLVIPAVNDKAAQAFRKAAEADRMIGPLLDSLGGFSRLAYRAPRLDRRYNNTEIEVRIDDVSVERLDGEICFDRARRTIEVRQHRVLELAPGERLDAAFYLENLAHADALLLTREYLAEHGSDLPMTHADEQLTRTRLCGPGLPERDVQALTSRPAQAPARLF